MQSRGLGRFVGYMAMGMAVLAGLSACAQRHAPAARVQAAQSVAAASGFATAYAGNGAARVFAAERVADPSLVTRIYIEGDGFAYVNRFQVSSDPTPLKPVLMALAAADPSPNVIYLGRPCQYGHQGCSLADWSKNRFAADKLAALGAAIDSVKSRKGLGEIELVGYSGGAHFAALLAATRCDVVGLRTIAGNLDVPAFIAAHNLDPLAVSDTPLAHAAVLREVPQAHLVSRDDPVITPELVQGYAARLGGVSARVQVVDGPAHGSGWESAWAAFLAAPLPAPPSASVSGRAGCGFF